MRMPGFSAERSLEAGANRRRFLQFATVTPPPVEAAGSRFGPTLPTCHWEKQWVVCGSALPGYAPPMCLEWVYVCKFPGSSRNALF